MTATLDTTPPFLTWDECADRGRERRLEHLATSTDPGAAETARMYQAHKSLAGDEEAFNDAWGAYREALRRRDGLATGELSWVVEYPGLESYVSQFFAGDGGDRPDPQEEAVQQACQDTDEALSVLMWGPKWGTR